MNGPPTLLVDTNVIIEAVRTGCWRAITGRMNVETVETCINECLRGDAGRSGYVIVSEEELNRLSRVHASGGSDERRSRGVADREVKTTVGGRLFEKIADYYSPASV